MTETERALVAAVQRAVFALRVAVEQLEERGADAHAQRQAMQDLETVLKAFAQEKPP